MVKTMIDKFYKKLAWFTLIETILTIIILSILITVIFQIFVVIWRIAIYIQQQKQIQNEVVYVTQTIQNLVDNESVVLTWYDSTPLSWANGYDATLKLTDNTTRWDFSRACDGEYCYINMSTQPVDFTPGVDEVTNVPITSEANASISNFVVKILPFEPEDWYEETMHDWFWMFIDARSPLYNTDKRRYRVDYKWQLFFNPRKY